MAEPRLPDDEAARLARLHALRILDTAPEERFDRITRLAAYTFEMPIALVSLVDADRQWFKSRVGLEALETSREVSLCGHALHQGREPLVVPDASVDPRFADNPLVTGDPHIRFYAGCPLGQGEGGALGTLCLVDRTPRDLSPKQREMLCEMAAMVERELLSVELCRLVQQLTEAQTRVRKLEGILSICSYCKNIRCGEDHWEQVEDYVSRHSDALFSHAICPPCYSATVEPQLAEFRQRQRAPSPT